MSRKWDHSPMLNRRMSKHCTLWRILQDFMSENTPTASALHRWEQVCGEDSASEQKAISSLEINWNTTHTNIRVTLLFFSGMQITYHIERQNLHCSGRESLHPRGWLYICWGHQIHFYTPGDSTRASDIWTAGRNQSAKDFTLTHNVNLESETAV